MNEEKLQETRLKVLGMDCEDEVQAVQAALLALPGIDEVVCNLVSSQVRVHHGAAVTRELLSRTVESTGLSVQENPQEEAGSRSRRLMKRSIVVSASGAFLLAGILLSGFLKASEWSSRVCFLLAMTLGASIVLPNSWRALRSFRLDMNVLMAIAMLGAVGIGEFAEAAAVVFLFAVAELLESFSLERARRSIQALLKFVPETAFIQSGESQFVEVPVSEVAIGSVIRVRSGSRIPLDGRVERGSSAVNQAPITGESLPVEKKRGDLVLAGTINGEGSLEVVTTQRHEDTKIAQIIRLIEEAQNQKAPTQRFVDLFAKYYTPLMLVVAVGVLLVPPLFFNGVWTVWVYRALVLLVIACPCALVISTPVSVVSGLTAMAKRGILIKGGIGLETIGKLKALAVDKTGTITEGVPRVLQIQPLNGTSELEILSIAASIDLHSTHPLAKAVVTEARLRGVEIPSSVEYRSVNGRGAEAVIDQHIFFVGNHRFAHDFAVCTPELYRVLERFEEQAQSVVVVGHRPHPGCKGEVIGVLGLGDAIRPEAQEAVRALHRAGIQSVVMLSGDNQRTVDAISQQVGIDEAYGDLLPDDKVFKVKELKSRYTVVGMIGDGANDAPAMATSSLGIAMGASGTDAAIETSDITLMQDRLTGVADAILMGKRTLQVIWFNTAFAIATKLVFLLLSVLGFTSLWLAIAADTGATLLVIANALRLLK